jgi:hypothetical protein
MAVMAVKLAGESGPKLATRLKMSQRQLDYWIGEIGTPLDTVFFDAIDRALTSVEDLVPKQDAEDTFRLLAARTDVLRLQVYIVNDILRAMIEASSGRVIDEERNS